MTENERMSISGLLDVLNTGISLSTCHIEYAIQSNVLEDLIRCLEELEQYRAIGTVEEFKKAKMQYDDIHSIAEKTALIGLSDYGTAKEAVITEMKRNLDYSLKEYQSIGTVEEFKVLKEKNVAKKPLRVPTDDTCLYYEFRCPSCGVWLSREIKRTHCKCNQKLDWQ